MHTPTLRLPGLALAVLLALAPGCGSGGSSPPATPPADAPPAVTPPAQPPPATGSVELTQFARTLIDQDTSDSAKPRELGGITFTDGEDPNAFLEDFFPQ